MSAPPLGVFKPLDFSLGRFFLKGMTKSASLGFPAFLHRPRKPRSISSFILVVLGHPRLAVSLSLCPDTLGGRCRPPRPGLTWMGVGAALTTPGCSLRHAGLGLHAWGPNLESDPL